MYTFGGLGIGASFDVLIEISKRFFFQGNNTEAISSKLFAVLIPGLEDPEPRYYYSLCSTATPFFQMYYFKEYIYAHACRSYQFLSFFFLVCASPQSTSFFL